MIPADNGNETSLGNGSSLTPMGSSCMGAVMGIPGTIDGFKIDIDDVLASAMRLAACESVDVVPDEHGGASILNFDGDLWVGFLPSGAGILCAGIFKSTRPPLGTCGSEKFVLQTLICSPFDLSEQRSDLCCIG
jgi:hypothetical protein